MPFTRQARTQIHMDFVDDVQNSTDTKDMKGSKTKQPTNPQDDSSLLTVLKHYSKDTYQLDPVLVPEEDYNVGCLYLRETVIVFSLTV